MQQVQTSLIRSGFKPLLAGLTFLAASASAQANLISNGDFEAGSIGWTLSNNVVVNLSSPGGVGNGFWFGGGNSTQSGTRAAIFNSGEATPNGVVSQSFATTAGLSYTVSFDYGVSTGGTQSILATILGANGTDVLGTQTGSDSNFVWGDSTLPTWVFSFVADGSTATLVFADNIANPTSSLDGILDNVTVNLNANAVPEPGTLALLGLAVVGMGRRMRRHTV